MASKKGMLILAGFFMMSSVAFVMQLLSNTGASVTVIQALSHLTHLNYDICYYIFFGLLALTTGLLTAWFYSRYTEEESDEKGESVSEQKRVSPLPDAVLKVGNLMKSFVGRCEQAGNRRLEGDPEKAFAVPIILDVLASSGVTGVPEQEIKLFKLYVEQWIEANKENLTKPQIEEIEEVVVPVSPSQIWKKKLLERIKQGLDKGKHQSNRLSASNAAEGRISGNSAACFGDEGFGIGPHV